MDVRSLMRPGSCAQTSKSFFITGYAENAVIGNGHLEKGMHVLAKPFEVGVLRKNSRSDRELIGGAFTR